MSLNPTLTDYEMAGLNSIGSLADGHAYHDIGEVLPQLVDELPSIWRQVNRTPVASVNAAFMESFCKVAEINPRPRLWSYRVTPTASNSIDIVSAYLAKAAPRVGLIEPTFDNLSHILKRRGNKILAIDENALHSSIPDCQRMMQHLGECDALFIVNPNNPSGLTYTRNRLGELMTFCATHKKILVIDSTFRMFSKELIDDRGLAESTGCCCIFIEDTGKTWPTQDMKASLIMYSNELGELPSIICDEIYLCHSRFTMGVFERIFSLTLAYGRESTVFHPVKERFSILKNALDEATFKTRTCREHSFLPVELIEIEQWDTSNPHTEDGVIQLLNSNNIRVLPASHFYWQKRKLGNTAFRVALSKPKAEFQLGIQSISNIVKSMRDTDDIKA